jgi:hypothetical protein
VYSHLGSGAPLRSLSQDFSEMLFNFDEKKILEKELWKYEIL